MLYTSAPESVRVIVILNYRNSFVTKYIEHTANNLINFRQTFAIQNDEVLFLEIPLPKSSCDSYIYCTTSLTVLCILYLRWFICRQSTL